MSSLRQGMGCCLGCVCPEVHQGRVRSTTEKVVVEKKCQGMLTYDQLNPAHAAEDAVALSQT